MKRLILLLLFLWSSCTTLDFHHDYSQQRYPAENLPSCADLFAEILSTPKSSSFGFGPMLTYEAHEGSVTLDEVEELKVWSLNTLNLVEHKGSLLRDNQGKLLYEEDGITPRYRKEPRSKDPKHQEEIGRILKENNPHFIALQEVEGEESIIEFTKNHLDSKYIPLMLSGNDTRDINVTLLVRKDLNIEGEYHSFRNMQIEDKNVFSRDGPVFLFWPKGSKKERRPVFGFSLRHLKSKRHRPDDPFSTLARTQEVEKGEEIHELLYQKYGGEFPMIVLGDFNNTVNDLVNAPEFSKMYEAGFRDSMDVAQAGIPENRVTHTYHPKEGPTEYNQIDSIQVNSVIQQIQSVREAGVYRYVDSQGKEKMIPDTQEQRKENPSDHFPVWANFDLKKIMSFWNQ